MTRSTTRDVERRLKNTPAGEPPADLLARLHAEIPPRLELAAQPPHSARRRLPPAWLQAAAVVVLALGGAWMLWRLSDAVLAPQAAVEEAPVAAEAGRGAFEAVERGDADAPAAVDGSSEDAARGGAEREASGSPGVTAGESVSSPAAAAAQEVVRPGGADVEHRPAPDAGDGRLTRRGEGASTDPMAGPPAEPTPPPATAGPLAARAPARAPGSSGLPDRRAEIEAESAQSLVEDLAAAGEEVADEPEKLAEEAAEAGEPRRVASGAPSAAAGTDRRQPPSPPAPQALAAPAAPAEADEPAPRARPFADESRARSLADAGDDRRSTVALHAGTGSWQRVGASLRRGELPPAGEVRVSEMVAAVDDGAPPPEPGESFRLVVQGAPSPFTSGPADRLLRIVVRAANATPGGPAGPVAEEARVQVDFDPRVVASWRLLGAEDGRLGNRGLRHEAELAGEIGCGHAVTALYEVRLAGEPPPEHTLARLTLRYRLPGSDRFNQTERTLRVADLSPTWEEAPPSLRLAAVAAELAEQLRGSRWSQGTDLAEIAAQAAAVAAERPGDERAAELADLAARAARLARRR